MIVNGLVFYKNQLQKINIEAALLPGIPRIEIFGLTKRDERKLSDKLRLWLRQKQLRFARSSRIVLSLNQDFSSHLSGLDLAAWLAVLALLGRAKNIEGSIFSGDYSLRGEKIEDSAFSYILKEQEYLNIVSPKQIPSSWYAKPSASIGSTFLENRIFVIKNADFIEKDFLAHYQKKYKSLCEPLTKMHKNIESRYQKILYCDIEKMADSDLKVLNELVLSQHLSCVLVVFSKVCPCGKISLANRKLSYCSHPKAYCQQIVNKLRQVFLDSFDTYLNYTANKCPNTKLTKDGGLLEQPLALSRANQRLLRQHLE